MDDSKKKRSKWKDRIELLKILWKFYKKKVTEDEFFMPKIFMRFMYFGGFFLFLRLAAIFAYYIFTTNYLGWDPMYSFGGLMLFILVRLGYNIVIKPIIEEAKKDVSMGLDGGD